MSDDKSRLVYSTEKDMPKKEKAASKSSAGPAHVNTGRIIIRLDRKKRGGKSVTLIEGLSLSTIEMEGLLKQIKADRGTGGTLKDEVLEIQGDHCGTIMSFLEKKGYKPRRAGGQ
jgi:translation initiation factor 1